MKDFKTDLAKAKRIWVKSKKVPPDIADLYPAIFFTFQNKKPFFERLRDHIRLLDLQGMVVAREHQRGESFPYLVSCLATIPNLKGEAGLAAQQVAASNPPPTQLHPGKRSEYRDDDIFRPGRPYPPELIGPIERRGWRFLDTEEFWKPDPETPGRHKLKIPEEWENHYDVEDAPDLPNPLGLSFDFETAMTETLSLECENAIYSYSPSAPWLPDMLFAILRNLESILVQLFKASPDMVPTQDHVFAVIDGLERIGSAVSVKAGEMMGFWGSRVAIGTQSATSAQDKQRKKQGKRRERTRAKISDFREAAFDRARHRIKKQTTKERGQSIDGLT